MSDFLPIRILYDGNCPICLKKTAFLHKRDRFGRLAFMDIRAAGFDAGSVGVPMAELERCIHAVLPDGSVVAGMEVIRTAYQAIGLGWLAAPTGWPLLRPLFDRLYSVVARHRHDIGRFFN